MTTATPPAVAIVPPQTTATETVLGERLRHAPIPDDELTHNAALFMAPRTIKRMFFLDEIYRACLPVHGIIIEFGVRWGRDLAVFDALRTIYEPFNISRRIVGFDTFEGFPSVHPKDGGDPVMTTGSYGTAPGYFEQLGETFALRQTLDPLAHLQRWEINKGDAGTQLEAYLERHPETIVALAYFDLDIYEPTKRCLELLKPFVTKGTVLAFDELNLPKCPGETVALREVYGLDKVRIRRSQHFSGQPSYLVIE